eukprot:UN12437
MPFRTMKPESSNRLSPFRHEVVRLSPFCNELLRLSPFRNEVVKHVKSRGVFRSIWIMFNVGLLRGVFEMFET